MDGFDVDSAVAGLCGLFFRVKSPLAELFGKPDVQDGLAGSGCQLGSPVGDGSCPSFGEALLIEFACTFCSLCTICPVIKAERGAVQL